MRVLLTGSTGQLGQAIIKSKPKEINLISTNRDNFNLENPKECFEVIEKIRPDWVINSGAYTNVDRAESEEELTLKVNYKAPEAIAYALNKHGGKLMQISTDYVFNGKKDCAYKVNDIRNPVNTYGESKYLAENAISNILPDKNQHIIIRTSWLISPIGKNFLLTILNLLKNGKSINVVNDQIGSITSTFSLSKTIWQLLEKNNNYSFKNKELPKVFHWCDKGSLSWYELALSISRISQEIGILENPGKINAISTKRYKFKAKRPKYSVLNCEVTENILATKRIEWEESLLKILNQLIRINKT